MIEQLTEQMRNRRAKPDTFHLLDLLDLIAACGYMLSFTSTNICGPAAGSPAPA